MFILKHPQIRLKI